MAVIDDVKALLSITGTDLDSQLTLIIDTAARQLLSRLPALSEVPHEEMTAIGSLSVPTSLNYIVREVAVKRFNRVDNEGMSEARYSDETLTFTGPEKDFDEFTPVIAAYSAAIGGNCYGKVRFI